VLLSLCLFLHSAKIISNVSQKYNFSYSFIINIIIIITSLLAQKHDKVTCATKQIERDSKDSRTLMPLIAAVVNL